MSKQTEELKNIIQSMEVEQLRDMLIYAVDHGCCELLHGHEESDVYKISVHIELQGDKT